MDFKRDILPLKNIMFRTALRITLSREEAEDIVQDCLIRIWRQTQDGVSIQNLQSYAVTIARNLALDRKALASSRLVSLDEGLHDQQAGDHSSPDEQLINNEHLAIVRQIIDRLPEKQRTVMQLRDVEEKTYKEIAEILSISESDVKVTLFRARKQVREEYSKLGIFD